MRAAESEPYLRKFVRSSGTALKNLGAGDVLRIATEHWLATQVDDARAENGDGLVAYFDMVNRGKGILFEFGVNRVMTPALQTDEYVSWLPAYRLRLSVAFKATLEVFQLGAVASAFTCWTKNAAPAFVEEVRSSPAFHLIRDYSQHSSAISLSECDAPWGDPMHPTHGLTWAIG